jgi:2-haloacid dehalogenase
VPRILVFDVNETLLNLQPLEAHFERVFGDRAVIHEWFSQVILYAEGVTLADSYRTFGEVATAALQMLAGAHGASLSEHEARHIAGGIRTLPPHPEVAESLGRLKNAGFRLVTLTNSPMVVVEEQMANANLQPYFERNFSVDTVRKFKPAPEPYRMVARELGTQPDGLRMIAAHAWDIGGALRVGYAAAFVARPGKALFPLFPQPDVVGKDLREVSDAILAREPRP